MKKFLFICTCMLIPLKMNSQEAGLGNWLVYIGNKQLNAKWNLHHEVQYRNYNAVGDLEQLLLRTGLGYNLGDKSNILLGYGYINAENYIGDTSEKTTSHEHRIYQQFITKQKVGRLNLQHRYRFEQRFLKDDFKTRFRYFLGLSLPFKKSNYYLSAYNEIFLNGQSSVFDRNRIYGGLGYQIKKNWKVELGYMNQVFENSGRDQINIITFLSF